MKPKIFSTEKHLAVIKPPAGDQKQLDYRDAKTPGLVLRVGKRRKTWQLTVRTLHTRRDAKPGEPTDWRMTRSTLGHYPGTSLAQARDAATRVRLEIKDHGQPLRTGHGDKLLASAQRSFAAAREKFLANAEQHLRPATATEYRATLNRADFEPWTDRPLENITPADVDALLAPYGVRPIAGKMRRVLGSLYRFAMRKLRWVTSSPIDATENPSAYRPRERVLTEAELQMIVLGATPESAEERDTEAAKRLAANCAPSVTFAVRFLLATGQRSSDLRNAQLEHFDHAASLWSISSGTHKSGRAHVVPLSALAKRLLNEWLAIRPAVESGLLVPSRNGTMLDICTLAHALRDWQDKHTLAHFHAHDLRRTAATGMQRLGVDDLIVHRVLGHTVGGKLAQSYMHHSHINERRDALELWGSYLERLALLS